MKLVPFSLDRMVRAVERIRERLLRATSALEQAQVPYAVVGGDAVAAWVARVDESAVRNTQDVDLLVRRSDFDAVKAALESVGFRCRYASKIDLFLDGPNAEARDTVHLVFAGEKVRADESLPKTRTGRTSATSLRPVRSTRAGERIIRRSLRKGCGIR